MYKLDTNFGSFTVRVTPSVEDMARYLVAAHRAGITIPNLKFQITELRATPMSVVLESIEKGL